MAERSNMRYEQTMTPIPDPTKLTTEALTREVAALKELVITRLDAMDKAMDIFSANLTRAPTDVDKQISHLRALVEKTFEVHLEKFASIQTQFQERDVRTEQTARDSKVAVDAALQAAKEAVGEQNKSSALAISKSEASTTKQIDQISVLIASSTKGLDDKIDDLKDRLTRVEGEDKGQKAAVTQQQTSNVGLVSLIGLIVGSLVGIGGLIVAFLK